MSEVKLFTLEDEEEFSGLDEDELGVNDDEEEDEKDDDDDEKEEAGDGDWNENAE